MADGARVTTSPDLGNGQDALDHLNAISPIDVYITQVSAGLDLVAGECSNVVPGWIVLRLVVTLRPFLFPWPFESTRIENEPEPEFIVDGLRLLVEQRWVGRVAALITHPRTPLLTATVRWTRGAATKPRSMASRNGITQPKRLPVGDHRKCTNVTLKRFVS